FSMTLAAALWESAFTLMYLSRHADTALFWARMAYLGVPFIAPALYHFTIEALRISRERRNEKYIGWLLALIFAAMASRTDLLVARVERFWWGYYPRYSTVIRFPFLLFFFGYLIAALVELIRAYPASRDIERKRIRLLLIGFAVAYVGCVD